MVASVHEGRIILRNIPFDIKDAHLKPTFSAFGPLLSINMPIHQSNPNLNRGFAFLEFEKKDDAQKAVDSFNGKKYKGRTIAVEFSVSKERYEKRVQKIVEHSKLDRKEVIIPKEVREETAQ